MIIVTGYRGGIFDEEIVGLLNKCKSLDEAWAERLSNVEDIRELWFRSTWYNPEDFAFILINDRVRGYAWAWKNGGFGRISLCVDFGMPSSILYNVVEALLSWARLRLEKLRVPSKVRIVAGYEHGYMHKLLREVVGLYPEDYPASIMVLEKLPKPRVPEGYSLREGGLSDVEAIVRVYNEAFSRYDWFIPWRLEDAIKWYTMRKPYIIVVEHHSEGIVGYIDAEIRRGIDGSVNAYIATLAVKPKHQGKGLGKALISTIASKLWNKDVERIFLDSVGGLEKFYGKLGFRVWRRHVSLLVPLSELPSRNITLVDASSLGVKNNIFKYNKLT
ncbi:MAG: hypothetical protein DRO40_10275 [Thermoprotei archaeon]|nr:MAG: hypothetical protein DRO40_10275 [Thermoprotei archaeon]